MKDKKIIFGTGGFSILAFIAALEETGHVLCGMTQTSPQNLISSCVHPSG